MENFRCRKCGSNVCLSKLTPPHIGIYCRDCGAWNGWIKQEQNIETGEIASEAQQKYAVNLLNNWLQSGKPLTVRKAGLIISAFKDG